MSKIENYLEEVRKTFRVDALNNNGKGVNQYIKESKRLLERREAHILEIMKMLDDLPDSNELVKIKLIKKALLQSAEIITRGWGSIFKIEPLIEKSRDSVTRRLESINE